ncbi:high-affinity branched-chain amino acid ABC transporter permease LivM [Eoetvoesiella caeni]|uniref:ABC-type branched-subunit amino acid transport system permease subunit n=1 Tax=Eoetvoesiella caeni TaxID=645616 RepID=A0A366HE32_9BURK|nr:high-affinity branched-chain amino acid ABC transporter permease LivM [Eoetvoesiella caeni]MCI2808787.1 high-affinity branched-chain amino acid ABC transporter permease LivM [Eoetvoesiella caeni]RBP40691.1 ABC-type branched-subunit amino acid transport system permease subunit [Eoetvoesiella caeni]
MRAADLKNALVAAILAGIIIAPIYGVQIVRAGAGTALQPDWPMILGGMALVFLFQLFRPLALGPLTQWRLKRQQLRSGEAWGPFLPPGRPKAKSAPSGGSEPRSDEAWGPFLPPGRPKAKSAPLGGSEPRSGEAWGPFLPPGRPKAKSAPSGGSEPRSGEAWGPFFPPFVRLRLVGLCALLLAVSLPFIADRAQIDIATLALIYIVLGLGLNIVVGFAGLLDLGYVGFYAIGAYAYALLYHWAGWGFWQSLPVAGFAAAMFGFLLGFPVLRLRGDYLAIVTLGFGEITRLVLTNMQSITNGPDGIAGIAKPTVFGLPMTRRAPEGQMTFHQWAGWDFSTQDMLVYMYFLALILALCTLLVTSRLQRMPIGRAWEALRDDEIACRSLGLNPARIKLSAFTLGAMFAGLGGAVFAARQGLVNPESFTFTESALVLAIVVLGGMGSQAGVILAAIVLTIVPELARELVEYRMLIFGLVMVLMMMWRPQGLLPARRPHVELEP